jgi:uncharacterized protein (TIGR04255 family)
MFRMDEPMPKLKNAPIVEAVLNIECDMPPNFDLAALREITQKTFLPRYPKFKALLMREHRLDAKPETETHVSVKNILYAIQVIQEDEKQLVQIRSQGFSFNRLAPYSTLDDYLGEMERTWFLFVRLSSPVQTRFIQLRYINRILLPAPKGQLVELEHYFRICPRLPDEEKLSFIGFLNQHSALENETGNHVNIILTTQPVENEKLPIIFDITATCQIAIAPENWQAIVPRIQSLRDLKNRVFRNTITDTCINLFQQ